MHVTCITQGVRTRTTLTRAPRPQHQRHTVKSTHAPLAQRIYNTHSAHAHNTHEQHTHNKYTCSQTTRTRQTSRPSQHTRAHTRTARALSAPQAQHTERTHMYHTWWATPVRFTPLTRRFIRTIHVQHSHSTICVHTYRENMPPEHHITTDTRPRAPHV